jgi:FSR family fosmidomycin resistance protein-like MFS transporter
MHKFGLSIQESQFHLFWFFSRCSSGDIDYGPLGDRFEGNTSFGFNFGRPLYLLLPMLICFGPNIISSHRNCYCRHFGDFSICKELMPGKVGMISGLFLVLP